MRILSVIVIVLAGMLLTSKETVYRVLAQAEHVDQILYIYHKEPAWRLTQYCESARAINGYVFCCSSDTNRNGRMIFISNYKGSVSEILGYEIQKCEAMDTINRQEIVLGA